MIEDPSSEEFFEAKYRQDLDPWHFATSSYERDRYRTLIDALPRRRFRRAFEPGCSVGVLTSRLAHCCDEVEAIDISLTAVYRAQARCRRLANVTISKGALLDAIPPGAFDLIVFSEIGYYFSPAVLQNILDRLVERLMPEGILLAAHWLGASPDHLLTGDQVHSVLRGVDGLLPNASERHDAFRVDIFQKVQKKPLSRNHDD